MPDLQIDTALVQIETALLREITFALRRSSFTCANPAALRIIPSFEGGTPNFAALELAYVTSLGKRFYWSQASTSTDDGITVIQPSDAGTTGRWLIVTSTMYYAGYPTPGIADGIVKEVVLHNGDFDEKVLQSRIFAKAPCVAIHFESGIWKTKSQIPGVLYDYRVKIDIWSVARNAREENEAALGSEIVEEFNDDPGVMRIHGSVRKFLAGQNIGIDSIQDIVPGEERIERAELAERNFVMAHEYEIRSSVFYPDEANLLEQVAGIDMQRLQSQVPEGGKLDLLNVITAGLTVPIGLGFAKTIAAGAATIGGVPVTVTGFSKTFTASTYTYRDLNPDGTWTFTELSFGEQIGAPAAGALRVGLTVTDSASVMTDTLLCSVFVPSEAPDEIEV